MFHVTAVTALYFALNGEEERCCPKSHGLPNWLVLEILVDKHFNQIVVVVVVDVYDKVHVFVVAVVVVIVVVAVARRTNAHGVIGK